MRTGKQFKQASLTTLRQNRRLAYAEASPDGEDWVEELEREVRETAHLPYATAIRHVLTRQSE